MTSTPHTRHPVGRKLTKQEWADLLRWRRRHPELAFKAGYPHPTDPGKVFRQYSRDSANGEKWTTIERHLAIVERSREWNRNNPEKVAARRANRSEATRLKDNARQRRWNRKRKESMAATAPAPSKQTPSKQPPLPKHVTRSMRLLNRCLAGGTGYYAAWFEMAESLGCGVIEIREIVESRMTEGMSWDNFGTFWEIGFIDPEAEELFHHSNLKPIPTANAPEASAAPTTSAPEALAASGGSGPDGGGTKSPFAHDSP